MKLTTTCPRGASGDGSSGGLASFASKVTSGSVSGQILNRVRGLVVTPDGKFVYVASAEGDSIACFERDMTSGALSYKSRLSTSSSASTGEGTYAKLKDVFALAVSQDGNNLYASTGDMTGKQNCMLWFAITKSTGALTYGVSDYDCHRNTASSSTTQVAETGSIKISPDQTKV
jgi:6-phosphogluconolactonase (cycloisomerase 2 family)